MNWNFRLFRLFGVDVRIHWTLAFLWVSIPLQWWLEGTTTGQPGAYLLYGLALATAFWASILFHEFGHIWAARGCGIPADSVLLWPLGGLAFIGGKGSARNEVWIAFAGPLASLVLAGAFLGAAAAAGYAANWSLIDPFRGWGQVWAGWGTALCVDLFRFNLIAALFNLCTPAYPLDGGRILRGLLAMRIGFERSTYFCTSLAIGVAAVMTLWGLVQRELNLILIGIFVLYQALQERRLLREGALEGYSQEFMGHDFSMGYTSLERGERPRRARRPGFFARLRQRRAEDRARRLHEEEAALRVRVDELLDKVSRDGIGSLTPDERRTLEEASRRFQEFDARRGR